MQDTVMCLSCLCMASALCTQLLHRKSYRFSIRLVLGLEIFRVMLMLAGNYLPKLN